MGRKIPIHLVFLEACVLMADFFSCCSMLVASPTGFGAVGATAGPSAARRGGAQQVGAADKGGRKAPATSTPAANRRSWLQLEGALAETCTETCS